MCARGGGGPPTFVIVAGYHNIGVQPTGNNEKEMVERNAANAMDTYCAWQHWCNTGVLPGIECETSQPFYAHATSVFTVSRVNGAHTTRYRPGL